MLGQEMQNVVCSERCIGVFIPQTIHRNGSTHKPIKATIFHAVPAATEGRISHNVVSIEK